MQRPNLHIDVDTGPSKRLSRRAQSHGSTQEQKQDSLGLWRVRAKAHADAQLQLLLASPSVAAAAAAGTGSRESTAAAKLLSSEQREALLKLRRLCQTFLGVPLDAGDGVASPQMRRALERAAAAARATAAVRAIAVLTVQRSGPAARAAAAPTAGSRSRAQRERDTTALGPAAATAAAAAGPEQRVDCGALTAHRRCERRSPASSREMAASIYRPALLSPLLRTPDYLHSSRRANRQNAHGRCRLYPPIQ